MRRGLSLVPHEGSFRLLIVETQAGMDKHMDTGILRGCIGLGFRDVLVIFLRRSFARLHPKKLFCFPRV